MFTTSKKINMARFLAVFFALLACLFYVQPAFANRSAELVADAETGRILFGDNMYGLRHPASLTKMMTLYITFAALEQGRLSLDDRLPISAHASVQAPSKLGLEEGGSIRVRDAILGLVTQSANDAAVVLAEGIGGNESHFAELMTQQARALGMKRTVYRNASGLHNPDQITTAFDQAILGRALLYHFPKYYRFFSTASFTYNGVNHRNHNHLMERYDGMDGIKTGFVNASGFNLVASAKRNGHRLIGVVFGGRSARLRDNRMAQLLNSGFDRVYAEARSGRTYPAANSNPIAADMTEADNAVAQGDASDNATDEDNAPSAAVEPPTKPAAVNENTKNANWGVQVGSYTSRKQCLSALNSAKKHAGKYLRGAKSQLVSTRSGGQTIYRARLTGLDERKARATCTSLSNAGRSCVTLPPRG